MSAMQMADMAEALAAVSMEVNDDEVRKRLQAAKTVAATMSVLDIVAAAYAAPAPGAREAVETAVRAADDAWLPGRRDQVLAVVASVAALEVLRDEDRKILAALACGAGRHLGYTPALATVQLQEHAVLGEAAVAAREREPLSVAGAAHRKLLTGEDSLEGVAGVSALRAMARRFEEVVAFTNRRLGQLDEELNVLWWSRADREESSGELWSEMSPVKRSVRAALEVESLIEYTPPTRGIVEVLRGKVGDLSDEAMATLASLRPYLIDTIHSASPESHHLLPLSSLATIGARYEQADVAAGVLLTETGLDIQMAIPVSGLAEQVVREYAILKELR